MNDEDRIAAAHERYNSALHAVQSGLAIWMNIDADLFSPKHMRVGIDATKADMGGLANLLIKKGLITLVEYHEAMADGMEQEKLRWERDLSAYFKKTVTLA